MRNHCWTTGFCSAERLIWLIASTGIADSQYPDEMALATSAGSAAGAMTNATAEQGATEDLRGGGKAASLVRLLITESCFIHTNETTNPQLGRSLSAHLIHICFCNRVNPCPRSLLVYSPSSLVQKARGERGRIHNFSHRLSTSWGCMQLIPPCITEPSLLELIFEEDVAYAQVGLSAMFGACFGLW